MIDGASADLISIWAVFQVKRCTSGLNPRTMEIGVPSCEDGPVHADIVKKYGSPDFVRTSKEETLRGGSDDGEEDEDATIYYYDYFGFEVSNKDKSKTVLRVIAHANDYSSLRIEDDTASFGQLSMQNLTVFHDKDGAEVGRLYYFMEGAKETVVIKNPPKGKYKSGDQFLEYLGAEKWIQNSYYEDGSLARKVPYTENRMNGITEGFYENGALKFSAPYKNGQLDGEVTEYTEDGKVGRQSVFKNGQRQK